MNSCLILTGTINPSIYNNVGSKITNVNERLYQYEKSIERYIKETDFNKIVFIENSNYNFNEKKFRLMADTYNKKFEFIKGKILKKEITRFGKGYGDAFLITEALLNSELLKNEDCFYKMSGRVFLANSKKIIGSSNKSNNKFIIYKRKKWCYSLLFEANIKDYINVLGDCYKECNDFDNRCLEQIFYKRLINSNIDISCFNAFPIIDGNIGYTNTKYTKGGIDYLIKNILIRIGAFSLK